MKKLNTDAIEIFNMDDLTDKEKQCINGLKEIDLDQTYLFKTTTFVNTQIDGTDPKHGTTFYFKTENGAEIFVSLRENKEATSIYVDFTAIGNREYEQYTTFGEIDSSKKKNRQMINTLIWNQLVDHFNLRIRLMFINEDTPWKSGN